MVIFMKMCNYRQVWYILFSDIFFMMKEKLKSFLGFGYLAIWMLEIEVQAFFCEEIEVQAQASSIVFSKFTKKMVDSKCIHAYITPFSGANARPYR